MNILNMTGFKATKEQLSAGMVETDYQTRKRIKELTQIKTTSTELIQSNLEEFKEILGRVGTDFKSVAIHPQPYLTAPIQIMIKQSGKAVVFPIVEFKREIYESQNGKKINIKKTNHIGFVTY